MNVKTVNNVKLNVGESEEKLLKVAEKELGCPPQYFRLLRKSLDARKKTDIKWVYSFECSAQKITRQQELLPIVPKKMRPDKPVLIVGSGPSGLFCALRLLSRGIQPILIERGKSVDERISDCKTFFEKGMLDCESNVQFGEGGAGTFSDGKLNTGTHSGYIKDVLKTFVRYGAPEEIEWLARPHIGSDKLVNVVKNMRSAIIEQGGMVRFSAKLVDVVIKDGKVSKAIIESGGDKEQLDVSTIVLAIGHSARDTFEMLNRRGVYMRSKDFAVGVRIEHLQSDVGFAQYGDAYKKLPAADYKLVSHKGDRAAFTFCMCPGGVVIPAASELGGVVTNGMSNYARDGANANSAVIVQVKREDFSSDDPLGGVEFQRKIEQAAFLAGGKDYKAPIQLLGDFLIGRESTSFGRIKPTYRRGTELGDLRAVLPDFIVDALKVAVPDMDGRLRGFCTHDALLVAPETRTSSPVRIERDDTMQSVTVKGVYPCGEGAGYAGGITSSAADGIRVADAICDNY